MAPVTASAPLSPGRAAVLWAVIHGARNVSEVAAASGRSRSNVHRHLECLRADGLVGWDTRHAGTLRPTVEVVAASPWRDGNPRTPPA